MTRVFVVLLLALSLCGALPSAQAEDLVPTSRPQVQLSFAPIVREVAPAVVSIYAEQVVNQRLSPFANDPLFSFMFGQQFGDNFGGMTRKRMESAMGSGVIVDSSGVIVTNTHVIDNAEEIKVVLRDKREFQATVTFRDDKADLAVLQLEAKATHLPALPLGDSDSLEVGDLVLALGNPFGVGQTVTSGIVSALARTADGINGYGYFIQTDAAINPGNSGGALVDMSGQLVGINTAIYSKDGGSLGIGFAIPVNMVKSIISASHTGAKTIRPWLGVGVQEVTADIAASLGMESPQGVLIKSLRPEGAVAKAGAEVGDIILAIGNQRIDNPEGLQFRTMTRQMGEKVPFSILRNGQALTLQVEMQPPPEDPPRQTRTISGSTPLAGAKIANLSPALADEIGYSGPVTSGVIVVDIGRRTPANLIGLKKGDVLLQINRQDIRAVEDVSTALTQGAQTGQLRLRLRRGDEVISSVLRN